jgi:phage terminase small subunit
LAKTRRKAKRKPNPTADGKIKLTQKEHKFLTEYVRSGNATQAALHAGYSPRSACTLGARLLRKVHIKEALTKIRKEFRNASKVTREQLVKELLKIIETPCTKAPTPAEKARAIEVVAKMHGFMIDKHEVRATTEDVVKIYIPHNGRDPVDPARLVPDPRSEEERSRGPEPTRAPERERPGEGK